MNSNAGNPPISSQPRPLQPDGRLHGVVVACQRNGKWLCIRRSQHVISPLTVCFPGGAIEVGEAQIDAVVREMNEEVGAKVRPIENVWRWDRPNSNLTLWGWTAELLTAELTPDPIEVAEILWLTGPEVAEHPDAAEQSAVCGVLAGYKISYGKSAQSGMTVGIIGLSYSCGGSMKRIFLAAWVGLGVSAAMAADIATPVDQIPVPPARLDIAPSTQPAMIVSGKVVVLPFELLGDSQQRDWIAAAMQKSLSAEIARIGGYTPFLTSAPAGTIDTASAAAAAKTIGGDVVIFGSCQFAGGQVRITGEVVDVKNVRSVAGLKVSGTYSDLFSLEDAMADQITHALKPPATHVIPSPAMAAVPLPPPANPAMAYYGVPTDAQRFPDQYNRYYYQPTPAFPFYGGFGGYFGGLNSSYFGSEYYPIIIITHGRDRGHDSDGRGPHSPQPSPVTTPPVMAPPPGHGRPQMMPVAEFIVQPGQSPANLQNQNYTPQQQSMRSGMRPF